MTEKIFMLYMLVFKAATSNGYKKRGVKKNILVGSLATGELQVSAVSV